MSTNKAAKAILATMWDGELPVPIERLVSSIRIKAPSHSVYHTGELVPVITQDEDNPSLSGSCSFDDVAGVYIISVNPKEPPLRKRFTIAHELGHIMQKHLDDSDKMHREDPSRNFYTNTYDPMEVAANGFAADVLMPTDAVTHFAQNTNLSVESMATKFNVSKAAMNYRLINLGLI